MMVSEGDILMADLSLKKSIKGMLIKEVHQRSE